MPFVLPKLTSEILCLAIGTLIGAELMRFLYRPKVKIRYKHITPLSKKDGFHITIHVANLGRTVAHDCKCVVRFDDVTASDIVDLENANPEEDLPEYTKEGFTVEFPRRQFVYSYEFRDILNESLCWAESGNPPKVDINPGTIARLDICKVQCSPDGKFAYYIIPSEEGWRIMRTRIKLGKLKGRILVCPANEFPTPMKFEIDLDADGRPKFYPKRLTIRERIRKRFSREDFLYGQR